MKYINIERYYSDDLKNWYKLETALEDKEKYKEYFITDGNIRVELPIPPGAIACRELLSFSDEIPKFK